MNNILEIKSFSGCFTCNDLRVGMIQSICYKFDYIFKQGLYLLSGNFDLGGCAFTYAISDIKHYKREFDNELEIYFNDENININEIRKITHNIGLTKHRKFYERMKFNTVENQVKKGIKANNLTYTPNEIRDMFDIDQDRFIRNIHYVSKNHILCNAAIGFAKNKKIFTFPWINKSELSIQINKIKKICNVLLEHNCILLLPTNNIDVFVDIPHTVIDMSDYTVESHLSKIPKIKCPCCEFFTLSDLRDQYQLCPVCYWKSCVFSSENPHNYNNINNLELEQAKENYRNLGASEEQFVAYIRKPFDKETPHDPHKT